MSHLGLDVFGRLPLVNQKACIGVSEIMEADISETCSSQCRFKMPPNEVVIVNRLSFVVGENKIEPVTNGTGRRFI